MTSTWQAFTKISSFMRINLNGCSQTDNIYIYIYIETIRTRSPSFFPLLFHDARAPLSNPRSRWTVREIMYICLRFIDVRQRVPMFSSLPLGGRGSISFLSREFILSLFSSRLDCSIKIRLEIFRLETRYPSNYLSQLAYATRESYLDT